jgi:hypothetical protein
VKRTMTGIRSSAGKGRKGERGGEDRQQMTAEQAAELADAKNARARAVKMVGDQLAKESDLALAHVLRSASMLQQRVSSWPAKHFVQPVKPFTQAAVAAVQDMPALCDRIDNAHIDLQEAGAHLLGLKEQLARMPPEDAGEVEHDSLLDSIEQAEDHVEVAKEVLASLEADWAAKVAQVNALDDLVVKVEDKRVNGKRIESVLHPAPQSDKMAKAHLREILSEACEGIFRGSIIKDFIPPNCRYIESLHLVLNTGNCCFEVLDRTLPGNRPDEWEQATGGSRQTKEWRQAGLDYQKIVEETLGGRSMRRPLTKYHGGQVEKLFRGQVTLLEHRLLSKGIAGLTQDKEAVQIVHELRACLEALAVVHQQVSIARPDIEVLEVAVKNFKGSLLFFSSPATPAPCRYTPNFYHAILDHIVDQCKQLSKYGLSLAMLSSKILEANNKIVKAVLHRLPVVGQRREGSHAHLPLVQGLKKCIVMGRVSRPALYRSLADYFKE